MLATHADGGAHPNLQQGAKNAKKYMAIGLVVVGILVVLGVGLSTHANLDELVQTHMSISAQGCKVICSMFPSADKQFCLTECKKLPRDAKKCPACLSMCAKHGGAPKPCRNSCKPVCSAGQVKEYLAEKAKQDVAGGSTAAANEFPTIAALFLYVNGQYYYFCAGVISSTQDVLTAGHCCASVTSEGYNVGHIRVRVGEHVLSTSSSTEQQRSVTKMTIHPNYVTERSNIGTIADLCILNLNSPLTMNSYVAFLWPGVASSSGGEQCTMAGWGYASGSANAVENTLKKSPMTTITDSSCTTKMGKTVYSDNVCAYYASGGGCLGDSGGPLTRNSDSRVIGIVSWGDGQCRIGSNYPTAFTEVNPYYTWVNATGVGETCVSQDSVVRVKKGGDSDFELTRLSDVRIGDAIETVNGYERVYFVVRPRVSGLVSMRKMTMERECDRKRVTISLTKEHLVFDANEDLTRADELMVGDVVFLRGCNGRVVDVSLSMEEPISVVTDSGEFLLANGVRVSTYSHSALFARVAHALSFPLRLASMVFGKNVGSGIGQALRMDEILRPAKFDGFMSWMTGVSSLLW